MAKYTEASSDDERFTLRRGEEYLELSFEAGTAIYLDDNDVDDLISLLTVGKENL